MFVIVAVHYAIAGNKANLHERFHFLVRVAIWHTARRALYQVLPFNSNNF
jgi:hypothetical protein